MATMPRARAGGAASRKPRARAGSSAPRAAVRRPRARARGPRAARRAARGAHRGAGRRARARVVGGELDVPGHPQAERAVLPGERHAHKAPAETWRLRAALPPPRTATITPELLAALAQVEGAGNPVARTYWRWRVAGTPSRSIGRLPARSACTRSPIGTFREAKRYCIRDHVVPRTPAGTRWFTLYACGAEPRDRDDLGPARRGVGDPAPPDRAAARQKQDLAAVIHLCGAGRATLRAPRLPAHPGQRCGDHDSARYLARVDAHEAPLRPARRRGIEHLGEEIAMRPRPALSIWLLGLALLIGGVAPPAPPAAAQAAKPIKIGFTGRRPHGHRRPARQGHGERVHHVPRRGRGIRWPAARWS